MPAVHAAAESLSNPEDDGDEEELVPEPELPELSVEEASLVAAQWEQYKTYAREAAWDPILRLNYWR